MWTRLKVVVSSRHNGPAFIAVSTSSVAEKAVPISVAEVSIPGFAIRFNDMCLEIERRNCRQSIIDFGISCRRAKIQRRRLLRDPFHARYMCGSPTPAVLSQRIGANPAK